VNWIAIAMFWLLVAVVIAQAALAGFFLLRVLRFRRNLLTDQQCPRAAVVLCLRGTDPFLRRCLEAILDQDYPAFELRIVIDHPSDPSHSLVAETLARYADANVIVQDLQQPREDCSLKCSSLIQAITTADDNIEIFAQLDADVIPHRTWLRELATALGDDNIAAATGNRWYMPHPVTFGSLVRYAWNAAAVVQMFTYQIAWGGSLAIKAKAIREAGLIERWGQAFCEDTMLFRVLRDKGWKTTFVPSLMMINRETCDVGSFQRWVQRQLLTARLYHPGWPAVLLHGWGTSLVLAGTVIALVIALASRSWTAVGWLTAALAVYEASMFALLIPVEFSIRRIVRSRGEASGWLSPSSVLKLLVAVPATQFVYPRALFAAMRMRIVDWRGVSYDVAGPWQIRLLSYQPYGPVDEEEVSTASL
jgi:cellulose synthase/poly-beta-1,6-N-acetylglucosamine synthase-like glycosyltransferase